MFHPGLKGRAQTVVAAGTGATPAAFYLGLCRLRGILFLPAPYDCAAGGPFFCAGDNPCSDSQIHPLKSGITAVLGLFLGKILQRLPSLALKSRIDAAFGLFLRVSLHRFPSLSLKSRIDVRRRAESGKSLHRFPSLGLKSRIDA